MPERRTDAMIARAWHGAVPTAKAEAYTRFLRERAIPDYQSTPGNRGVYILRRIHDDRADFLLVSLWDSREAIAGFAGAEIDKARYYPEDDGYLLEKDPHVTHYEVVASAVRAADDVGEGG